jgi:hypothetical protein
MDVITDIIDKQIKNASWSEYPVIDISTEALTVLDDTIRMRIRTPLLHVDDSTFELLY